MRSSWAIGTRTSITIVTAFTSRLVDASKATALMVMIATTTGSPGAIAALAVSASAPVILLGPLIGAQIDRRSSSKILVAGLTTQAAVAATLFALSTWGDLAFSALICGALLLGICQAITDNCLNALIPQVTPPDLVLKANGLMSTGQSIARIVGPFAGSALAILAPNFLFFSWAAVSVLLGLLAHLFLDVETTLPTTTDHGSRWSEGIIWIARSAPARRLLLAVTLNNLAYGCMTTVLPIIALEDLALLPQAFGTITSVTSASALLGSILVTTAGKNATLRVAAVGSLAVQLVGFALLALAWSTGSLYVAIMTLGFSTGVWNVVSSSKLMQIVPGAVRGRAISTYRSIAFAGSPMGNATGGLTGENMIRLPLYVATCAAAISLAVFARRSGELSTDQET